MTFLPILATAVSGCALLLAITFFRELAIPRRWLVAVVTGGIAAGLTGLVIAPAIPSLRPYSQEAFLAAIVLALFSVRSARVDGDFVEGLISGSILGLISGTILSLAKGDSGPRIIIGTVIEATAAGLLTHLFVFRYRRLRVVATVGLAVLLIVLHPLIESLLAPGATWRHLAFVIAACALADLIGSSFAWSTIRDEFHAEARLGVIPEQELPGITSPIRRLRRMGWRDRPARREYVKSATALAVRRWRQKKMSAEEARLYQLEVLQLRQHLQELYAIELSVRAQAHDSAQRESSESARMTTERADT